MRIAIALGLVLFLCACGASDDATDTPADGTAAQPASLVEPACPTVTATWRGGGNLLEFSAWEMGCSGCESTIQSRIGELDGVADVAADLESAVVKVTLEDGADREKLTEQITQALEAPESGKKFTIIRAAQ